MITEEDLKNKIRSKVELLNAGGNKPCLEYAIIELLDVLDDDSFSTEIFDKIGFEQHG